MGSQYRVSARTGLITSLAVLALAIFGLPAPAGAAIARPHVTRVSPNHLKTGGGTTVTATGTGFSRIRRVTIGGRSATHLRVLSTTRISFIAPPNAAGRYDIRIVGANGTSPAVAADRVTYVAPPSITGVTPSSGSTVGGTQVAIWGRNLLSVSKVAFGTTAAKFEMHNGTVVATAPVHVAGPVSIRITSAFGTSAATASSRFTYVADPPAPRPTWSGTQQAFPVDGPTSYLSGNVQCFAVGNCVAAGLDGGSGATRTSAVFSRLTNGSWTSTLLVLPANALNGTAVRMSCADAEDCTLTVAATISGSPGTVVDTLANGNWSTNTISGTTVVQISCASVGGCVAIGKRISNTGELQLVSYTLADGTWTPTYTSGPWTTSSDLELSDLTCPSTGQCVAVGSWSDQGVSTPTAMVLTNGQWQISSLNAPYTDHTGWLSRVFCTSVTTCTAFGNGNGGSFTATLAAGLWTTSPMASPQTKTTDMGSMACGSPTDCWAVDQYAAEHWSGGVWTTQPLRGLNTAATPSSLTSTCLSTAYCVFVGDEIPGSGAAEIMSSGTWSQSYVPGSAPDARLTDVSCPTASMCLATGSAANANGPNFAFAEVITPTATTLANLPNADGTLLGTACASATFCAVAAGTITGSLIRGPSYLDVYDAGTWSSQQVPFEVFDVSCPAVGTCVAVGRQEDASNVLRPWYAVLSGGTWTSAQMVSPPDENLAVDGLWLQGIDCGDATHCVAVGSYSASSGADLPLQEDYSAGTWSIHALSVPGSLTNARLRDVSCVDALHCTAVGDYYDGGGRNDFAIAEDGTSTTYSAFPEWGNNSGYNSGGSIPQISCPTASACVVSDTYAGNALGHTPIVWIQTSNGWMINSPAGPTDSTLAIGSISCFAPNSCVGVGSNDYGAATLPEVYRYG